MISWRWTGRTGKRRGRVCKSIYPSIRKIISKKGNTIVQNLSTSAKISEKHKYLVPVYSFRVFVKQSDATMHLPAAIGDYSDFFSSYYHAYNCSLMFKMEILKSNWYT